MRDSIKAIVAKHIYPINLFADDRERLENDITNDILKLIKPKNND